jgi:hypothetical protein
LSASQPVPQGIAVLAGPSAVGRSSRSIPAWSARSLEPIQRLPHPRGSHTRPHLQDLKKSGPGPHRLRDAHRDILESAGADLTATAIGRLPGGPRRAGKPSGHQFS